MRTLALVLGLVAVSSARGQLVVEEVGVSYLPTDVSSNGAVVVGNIYGPYETFYWSADTGPLPLGRATVPVLGAGAGSPNVSADGTKVSATIISDNLAYTVAGIWDLDNGWQVPNPPTPPDGGVVDNGLADAWGLSGDGNTVVGLYWRAGQPGGSAHPYAATLAGGPWDLGTPGGSGRANAASYDGSVIAGWSAGADGLWDPTVWVNGVRNVLEETGVSNGIEDVNRDGTILVGRSYTFPNAGATIWRWTGSTWDREYVGGLPVMIANWGLAWFSGVSADGGMIVGATRPAFSPAYIGMLWTPDSGLIDANDWVAAMGASTHYYITQLSAVSDDGRSITAITQNQVEPYQYAGVLLRCVSNGDADADGDVDLHDAAILQRSYTGAGAGPFTAGSQALDFNCDLDIDLNDVAEFAGGMTGPQ